MSLNVNSWPISEHLRFSPSKMLMYNFLLKRSTMNLGFWLRYRAGICSIFDRLFDPYGWWCLARAERHKMMISQLKTGVYKWLWWRKLCWTNAWSKTSRCSEPIRSMYGIFTYIYHNDWLNVGKYTMDGMGKDALLDDWDFVSKLYRDHWHLQCGR